MIGHWRRPLALPSPKSPAGQAAFTLIELLTVITIIAILATLLMTTLSSVKRKAREAVCISNLHQIGIALHLYLEDYGKRPPSLLFLARSKYLGNANVLTCPADRSAATGRVAQVRSPTTAEVTNAPADPHVSYEDPLSWSDDEWNRLMQAQTRAGIVVCTFHDVRSRDRDTFPADGLILRGQLDGTVVRRHIFDTPINSNTDAGFTKGATPDSAFAGNGGADPASGLIVPPWNHFSDEPHPETVP